jgi:dihydrofolate reductase
MRKLIVSMNVTLDGFMSGPDCELDWHFSAWNNEMAQVAAEQLNRADTIILGRITYRAMARYWPMQAKNMACAREDIAFADMMNTYTKIVFSKTLQRPEWHNTKLVTGRIAEEIASLKQQPGKDMIIYGSGKLVAALMQLHLVDEYQLWIHPVVLGKGKPLFGELKDKLNMRLISTTKFGSGVVMMSYDCFPAVT